MSHVNAKLLVVWTLTLVGCTGNEKPIDTGTDLDGDGYYTIDDCDDENAAIYPGAEEICDTLDNNCDGETDEGVLSAWHPDVDGDGYGDSEVSIQACEVPSGHVEDDTDCNDRNPDLNPETTWYADNDADSFGDQSSSQVACEQPTGFVGTAGDCNDGDSSFYPGAAEADCTDANDYNCDGSVAYEDADQDGFPACEDCDDTEATTNEDGEETCDGVDNDCDGTIDNDATDANLYYQDADGDGFGDTNTTAAACELPPGHVSDDTDCDDQDNDVFPGAAEICNGEDDDCDSNTDEDDATDAQTWYADTDSDGHGDASNTHVSCSMPSGHVEVGDDCDDSTASISPSADELCNGTDDDCDGATDESDAIDEATWYADADSDGHGDPNTSLVSCDAPSNHVSSNDDCDDTASAVHPNAEEICDSIDNDCDGTTDEPDATDALVGHLDYDGDGFGGQVLSTTACVLPSGYVTDNTDCDDTNANANPGAIEVCTDSADNNCDGSINEPSAIDAATWYVDADGDGHGDSSQFQQSCDQPNGYALLDGDCNENDANIHPSATEISGNGIDDNCENDLPDIQSVTLSHTDVFTNTVLTAVVVAADPEGETLSLSYAWVVDGVLQSETTSSLDGATAFDKNQAVSVEVTADDGTDQATLTSDTLVVLNTPPTPPGLAVDPTSAPPGTSDIVCIVESVATDADNDPITYSFSWLVDGVAYDLATDTADTALYASGPQTTHWPADTILAADTTANADFTCQGTAEDGTESSTVATAVFYGCNPGSQSFTTGGTHTLSLQGGCTTYTFEIIGAGGTGQSPGGRGGHTTFSYSPVGIDDFQILVGENRSTGSAGGGASGSWYGGGASAVTHGTTLLAISGGGGAGSMGAGGNGGGGNNAGSSGSCAAAGSGGGNDVGGTGGGCAPYCGGNGGSNSSNGSNSGHGSGTPGGTAYPTFSVSGGGAGFPSAAGGGGGYGGGGGGGLVNGNCWGGGGGGGGYANLSLITDLQAPSPANTGTGYVTIYWSL